tara:strand:- start:124 stop:999 length:876 start_codon:yes stop_codon:yes gene_type:complete
MNRFKSYIFLFKFRLSLTVAFSASIGFILPEGNFSFLNFVFLIIGGSFLTFSANGFNQILEIKEDSLMKRTKVRPLVVNSITKKEAFFSSLIIFIVSILLLFKINFLSFVFGFLAFLIYVFIYTPLKKKTPLSIVAGAVSGSLPFMLGWVARTGDFDVEPGFLFALQFLWQFPHFFSIASLYVNDYKNAGFKMTFSYKGKNLNYILSCFFSFLLILLFVLPFFDKLGQIQISYMSSLILLLLSIIYFYFSLMFYFQRNSSNKNFVSKRLKYFSYLFLPLVQVILILDKIIF